MYQHAAGLSATMDGRKQLLSGYRGPAQGGDNDLLLYGIHLYGIRSAYKPAGSKCQERQRNIIGEGIQGKAQELAMVVLFFYTRTLCVVVVNSILVVRKSMDGLLWGSPKKQHHGKPQRKDSMEYSAQHYYNKAGQN